MTPRPIILRALGGSPPGYLVEIYHLGENIRIFDICTELAKNQIVLANLLFAQP